MITNRLEENRIRIDLELRKSSMRQYFSPALMCLHQALHPRLMRHAAGRLLDAGCGVMPFKSSLEKLVDEYHSIDIKRKTPDVDFIGDLEDMMGVTSEHYDTVLCTEVLEHVRRPERVIAEAWRVLKPGGKLILSVPYLSRLHEEPCDYYRFTKHGLTFLIRRTGFTILEIVSTGSLCSFVGHQLSTILVGLTWHIPVVGRFVFFVNAGMCTLPCYALDKLIPISAKFPLGYVAIAQKVEEKSEK